MRYEIKTFPNEKALLSVKTEEKELPLLYRRLAQYNKDLTSMNVEEVSVSECDHLIVCAATAYKGQTGLVFVWDLVKNRIIHISDGEFAVRVLLIDDKVYSLHFVSYWGKNPEFKLNCMKLGNKDLQKTPDSIPLPKEIANRLWPENGKVEMKHDYGELKIIVGSYSYNVKI